MIKTARAWIIEHQLFMFTLIALIIAGILTLIGLQLYNSSGAAKLDLSRPGYVTVRESVDDNSENDEPFSASGNLDKAAVKDFQGRWTNLSGSLDKMGGFQAETLSDENLGLKSTTPESNPKQ